MTTLTDFLVEPAQGKNNSTRLTVFCETKQNKMVNKSVELKISRPQQSDFCVTS